LAICLENSQPYFGHFFEVALSLARFYRQPDGTAGISCFLAQRVLVECVLKFVDHRFLK